MYKNSFASCCNDLRKRNLSPYIMVQALVCMTDNPSRQRRHIRRRLPPMRIFWLILLRSLSIRLFDRFHQARCRFAKLCGRNPLLRRDQTIRLRLCQRRIQRIIREALRRNHLKDSRHDIQMRANRIVPEKILLYIAMMYNQRRTIELSIHEITRNKR